MTAANHAATIKIERAIEDALRAQGHRPYRADGHLYVTLNRSLTHINLTLVATEVAQMITEARSA